MEGEGEGLIEREGVLDLIAVSLLSFIALFSLCIPIVVSLLSACLCMPPLSCPHSLSSSLCGHPVVSSRIVFPCGCCGA